MLVPPSGYSCLIVLLQNVSSREAGIEESIPDGELEEAATERGFTAPGG